MKSLLLAAALLLSVSLPALAENTLTVNPNTGMIDLPGNAHIITNDDDNTPRGIIIRNRDSIWYRAITAPLRPDDLYVKNRALPGATANVCGQITNINDRNKCIGEAIREQEKLRRKYD